MSEETETPKPTDVAGRLDGLVMPSDIKKPLIEIFFLDNETPFICGVNGHVTISMLEEIERDLGEYISDTFTKGQGSYLFEAYFNSAQRGDEGRIEIPEYWELTMIGFKPCEA